jgi:hypothetical protein
VIARAARRIGPQGLAILLLVLACACVVQGVGDNQTSHYALVRAMSDGTPRIDPFRGDTWDKVEQEGHWYSNKPPGLAATTVIPYAGLDAAGIPEASRRSGGGDESGPAHFREQRGIIWALGLFGVVIPGLVLLFLVRSVAERFAPGFGSAAAVTLGLCTLLLPFLTMFYAHVLAVTLAFASFTLVLRERERDGPVRLGVVGAAGLLAGLAVVVDYPLAAVGGVIFLYALASPGRLRTGGAYAAGVVVGVLPLLAYNTWAFGSPFHISYSGFEVQTEGLFGVRVPSLRVALELLFDKKGLLVMSPVVGMAVAGLVLLYRAGRRAEALTLGGVALAVFVYNAGFYLDRTDPRAALHPFGGSTPGPRLLVPALPFLSVGLALAYRRMPVATITAALISAGWMLAATLTQPQIYRDIGIWGDRLADGDFTATVFTRLGLGNGPASVVPFILLVVAAVVLAARAAQRPRIASRDTKVAVAVAAASLAAALLGHRVLGSEWGLGEEYGRLALVLLAALGCALVLLRSRLPAVAARRPSAASRRDDL